MLFGFEAFDAFAGVLIASLFQIHIVYIRQGAEPGKNVGKFFLFVVLVVRSQGGGKLTDFFNKPHKGGRNSPLPVPLSVFFGNYTLKFANMHFVRAQEHKSIRGVMTCVIMTCAPLYVVFSILRLNLKAMLFSRLVRPEHLIFLHAFAQSGSTMYPRLREFSSIKCIKSRKKF